MLTLATIPTPTLPRYLSSRISLLAFSVWEQSGFHPSFVSIVEFSFGIPWYSFIHFSGGCFFVNERSSFHTALYLSEILAILLFFMLLAFHCHRAIPLVLILSWWLLVWRIGWMHLDNDHFSKV